MSGPMVMRNGMRAGLKTLMGDGGRSGLSTVQALQSFKFDSLSGSWAQRCCFCSRATSRSSNSRISRSVVNNKPAPSLRLQPLSAPYSSWHTSPAIPPSTHPTTSIPLPEQLRSIMRLLAHSVVVCTSVHENKTPRAMTMSSFTSLTLAPTPLITFNIATPSRTFDAIASSGEFNIHVLAGDATGAAVADHFTKGNTMLGAEGFAQLGGVKHDERAVLSGEGVLFVLRCRVLREAPEKGLVRVRDHIIVVGEVMEMITGEGEREFGLVYADRRYRTVGGVLEKDV